MLVIIKKKNIWWFLINLLFISNIFITVYVWVLGSGSGCVSVPRGWIHTPVISSVWGQQLKRSHHSRHCAAHAPTQTEETQDFTCASCSHRPAADGDGLSKEKHWVCPQITVWNHRHFWSARYHTTGYMRQIFVCIIPVYMWMNVCLGFRCGGIGGLVVGPSRSSHYRSVRCWHCVRWVLWWRSAGRAGGTWARLPCSVYNYTSEVLNVLYSLNSNLLSFSHTSASWSRGYWESDV